MATLCLQSARRIDEAAGFRLIGEERHGSVGHDLVGQTWDLLLWPRPRERHWMDANPDIAGRIERRLDALGLQPEQVDAQVGLPSGTTERLRQGIGFVPGGRFLRGLCAALDTDEEYLLGLEPGDLIPAELLLEPQGELGLLAPDEEALLKHYRSLSIPVRAAVAVVVATAAGAVAQQAETQALRDAAEAPDKREGRSKRRDRQGRFDDLVQPLPRRT